MMNKLSYLLLIYGLGFGLDSNGFCICKRKPSIDLTFPDGSTERLTLPSATMERAEIAKLISSRLGLDYKSNWIYLTQTDKYGFRVTSISLNEFPFYKRYLFHHYDVLVTPKPWHFTKRSSSSF